MAIVNMVSRPVEHYRKIEAFFSQDDEVFVVYDNEIRVVKLYVSDPDKAEAIDNIIEHEMIFGNEVLKIAVIPGNKINPMNKLKKTFGAELGTYHTALNGNGALSYIRTIEGVGGTPFTYIVFQNEVVQYFRDDLSDIHRMRSTLYEDLAREIFVGQAGVYYNTDLPGKDDF